MPYPTRFVVINAASGWYFASDQGASLSRVYCGISPAQLEFHRNFSDDAALAQLGCQAPDLGDDHEKDYTRWGAGSLIGE
jgi:hypothetical protein